MRQFAILATIPNFNKKQSYGHLGLNKRVKRIPTITATAEVVVNKCINTTVARKKHTIDPAVKLAKKESTFRNGKKPTLLASSKLN